MGSTRGLASLEQDLQKRAHAADTTLRSGKVKAHEAVGRVRAVLDEMARKHKKENPLIVGGRPVDDEGRYGLT